MKSNSAARRSARGRRSFGSHSATRLRMPESKVDASVSRDTAAAGARCAPTMTRQAPATIAADASIRIQRLARMVHQRGDVLRARRVAIGAAESIGESIFFARHLGLSRERCNQTELLVGTAPPPIARSGP